MDDYDKKSPQSIFEYSLKLVGKSLSEVVDVPLDKLNSRDRGNLGSLVERYFFKHTPPNTHAPDFPDAELELKVTGLIKDSKGNFKAKERLVLTMINYEKIVDEAWISSSFVKKCKNMLILFYLFKKDSPVETRKFPIRPLLYQFPAEDLPIIRRDWEYIKNKVVAGKAHELSEGDTFYLGACRKGSGGPKEALRKQPMSNVGAPARAFSFKQGYLNSLISGHVSNESSLGINENITFDDATKNIFQPYMGKTVEEIIEILNFDVGNKRGKQLLRQLSEQILLKGASSIRELVRAGIELKTVRLAGNGIPRESMSFPAFKYMDIVNQSWEDSYMFDVTERKFLFIVFKKNDADEEVLHKVAYWNMPYADRLEMEKVWNLTKLMVVENARNLPKMKENRVAHVRPHARNSKDTYPTPQGENLVKKCFWLNAKYLAEVIEAL